MELFKGRKLIIATRHAKEQVLAPILEKELGVLCFTDDTLDTDVLGTFTGQVPRVQDPVTTAREKCLMAMRLTHADLGVASEGSFGPHPAIFFAGADEEFLIFIDLKHNLEVIVRELSIETNFNAAVVDAQEELIKFAASAGFPEHALILRPAKDHFDVVYTGIQDPDNLMSIFQQLKSVYGTVYVETDMRAMHNPTRMKVIQKAVHKLIDKVKSTCPQCHTPGYGISQAVKGLACSACGSPTKSILSYVYQCQHCHYTQEKMYPHNKISEDPMYCDFCNP